MGGQGHLTPIHTRTHPQHSNIHKKYLKHLFSHFSTRWPTMDQRMNGQNLYESFVSATKDTVSLEIKMKWWFRGCHLVEYHFPSNTFCNHHFFVASFIFGLVVSPWIPNPRTKYFPWGEVETKWRTKETQFRGGKTRLKVIGCQRSHSPFSYFFSSSLCVRSVGLSCRFLFIEHPFMQLLKWRYPNYLFPRLLHDLQSTPASVWEDRRKMWIQTSYHDDMTWLIGWSKVGS